MTDHNNNNCYSEKETAFMLWGQRIRGFFLRPLLVLLTKCHIKPDHITLLSLLCGILGALILYSEVKYISLIFIFLHVLLDGLDGPLARFTDSASNRGSFTDTACDQLVIVTLGIVLIDIQIASLLPGTLYILSYTLVVGFAMVRNALNISYSWLVRPRFIVFCWLPVELYLYQDSIDYLLIIANILLIYKTITGYIQIRRAL